MKHCARSALFFTVAMFICCNSTFAYGAKSFPPFKLKNETENLLAGIYSSEVRLPNISEKQLFCTAMKSSADDQFQAGLLFGRGQVVKRNFLKCIALLETAADKGHIDASFLLGTIYLKGGSIFKEIKRDVEYGGIVIPGNFPYDIGRAFHYYLTSGNRGDKLSQDACLIIKKHFLETKTDAARADKIRSSLEESAGKGNALALRFLAELYSDGQLVEEDEYKAFDLFKQSADYGDMWGEYNIARKYISGLGVEQDIEKGFMWMKKAAEHNLTVAQFDLAVLYYLGTGTAVNKQMGYVWLLVAKANGHKEAESIVDEEENSGLTPEEEKKAHEIAAKILTQMSTQKDSNNLITALNKTE